VAAVHRHLLAEGGDLLGKRIGLGKELVAPEGEDLLRGREQRAGLILGERARELDRAHPRLEQDLVGVGVADARQDGGIGHAALERVVLARERLEEALGRGGEGLDAAGIKRAVCILSGEEMHLRALLGARFGQEERAVREVERGHAQLAWDLRARLAPAEPAGDHEVDDDLVISFEVQHDALCHARDPHDLEIRELLRAGGDGPEQERARETDARERLSADAARDVLDVELDVG
jgi:hypothetical protein